MTTQNQENKKKKEKVGIVVSNKMQKTIVVQIHRKTRHPLYGKVVNKAKKFKVHDEKNQAQIGDKVRIVETRPLSKEKRWRLLEIISRGNLKSSAADIKDVLEVAKEA